MMSEKSLSIIVVNYNTHDCLKGCLRSIETTIGDLEAETIVVDNHSQDESAAMVERSFPAVRLIANRQNLGYAKAVNQGINASRGEYILVLNADTLMTPRAIPTLLNFLEHNPKAAIAGPKLRYADGRLQHSCRTFYDLKTLFLRRTFFGKIFSKGKIMTRHLMLDWDHGGQRAVDWLVGAALIVRRKALDRVGLMDERYFLYFEDVDWCYRMKTAGWQVCYVPEAEMLHHYRQGSRAVRLFNRDVFIHLASLLRYYEKWNKGIYFIKRFWHMAKRPAFMMLDFVGILVSFWMIYGIRECLGDIGNRALFPISIYFKPVALFSICALSIYYLMGLYDVERSRLWIDRLMMVGKGTLISSGIVALVFLFSSGYQAGFLYSRMVLVSFVMATILLVTLIHQAVYVVESWLWRHGFNLKRLLIVGGDQLTLDLKMMLSRKPELGYDVCGPVLSWNSDIRPLVEQVLGDIDSLPLICGDERIQEVIFVNSNQHYQKIIRSMIRLRENFINVRIVSNDLESEAVDPRMTDFFGFPSLNYECRPSYYAGLGSKRTFDITVASLCLILLSPVIALIALKLRLGKGGAFFVQKRMGKGGGEFSMYKFRTMMPNAENHKSYLDNMSADGRLFKVQNDMRVTRFGRFLRKYNLDEIPQLFNILKGDMSLIGPRPPLPEEVALYEKWHLARLEVRPGVTGLWQVDKKRKWKFDEMVRLDIHYILNWSLLLDFKILLRTPGAILRGTGL